MKTRILMVITLLLVSTFGFFFAAPQAVYADTIATACKWNFPWPRTVYYLVYTGGGQFTDDDANRVAYGAETWSAAGFNLILQRTFSRDEALNGTTFGLSYVHREVTSNPSYLAETFVSPTPNCNVDGGNPITSVRTRYNPNIVFYPDCAAIRPTCEQNGWYDLHDNSTHEFGHWFTLGDDYNVYEASMYWYTDPGRTYARDLSGHDINQARLMYGCRFSGPC